MKHQLQITIASVLLGLVTSPAALAAEAAKKPPTSPRQQVFAK